MSKKKSAKTEISVKTRKYNEDAWIEPLESVLINDDHWWCIVTMMVETRSDHARLVSLFNEAAEEGKRKAIYTLSYQQMLTNVRSLARQDPEKCPVMQRICHYANKQFEVNEESTWLMARVIKYMIYRSKVEVVTRVKKEQELKRAIDEEYRIMQTVLDPTTSRSVQKKGESQRTLLGKANTRLRIREEEWRDIVYVDDAPLDGPNLYIILTGFHDADLLVELMNVGVPLTCILKIRRPGEQFEHVPSYEMNEENFTGRRKSRFPETYIVDKADLRIFWTSLKNVLDDPQTVQAFANVAFLTFKPPSLPDDQPFDSDDFDYEPLKKDIYDRVSFIVYDLYDLLRKHSNYLRSMLIQRYDVDEMEEPESNLYRALLDVLPTECVTVPTLLHALLLQLEANLEDVPTDRSSHEQNVPPGAKEEKKNVVEKVEPENEVESIDEISWVREKLKLLNRKYDLRIDESSIEEKLNEQPIELILHGDNLRLNTYHVKLESDVMKILEPHLSLADAVLQVFLDPRITNCWLDQERLTDDKIREYHCHINNIIRYFDPGVRIDRENIVHYFHLMVFDKMIRGDRLGRNERRTRAPSVFSPFHTSREILSEPFFKNHINETNRLTKSDTEIDYGKPIAAFSNCSALFGLTDPREIILPGYLEQNVYGEQRRKLQTPREFLEEYEDVELLPRRVLLQACYECFQYFERFERRYFEPTDSTLLYFSNDYVIGDVTERRLVSSIRTPVYLRDFVRYLLKEEVDWLDREEEKYRLESIEAASKSTIEGSTTLDDIRPRFTDEHFILPNSLKARDMNKKLEVSVKQQGFLIPGTPKKGAKGEEKIPKSDEKGRRGKAFSEKISLKGKKREANGIDTSFLPPRKILSLECAKEGEPYEFVGYDLGNLRVQVVEKRKIFHSMDGTLVRVNLERWLYEKPDLRIDVTLHACTLRLAEKLNDLDAKSNVIRLSTEEGVLLAFSKRIKTTDIAANESHWKELDFDFHASWSSGLMISLVTGDTAENPFYIRQSYLSKRPEDVVQEAYRKFLRNGTVLKFFDDNRVIVLRPNGAVIECTAFEDATSSEKNSKEDDPKIKVSREKDMGRGTRRKKGTGTSNKPQLAVRSLGEEDNEELHRITSTNVDEPMSQPDVRTGMRYTPTRIKVTGYNVLDHDGRRYEVLRDLVVREYDRLPVRASSDYELGENFMRRSDGTNMLFRSNGELIVNFTDGTRIITGYIVEEEPLICDWTVDEFRQYFGSIKLDEYGDGAFSSNDNNNNKNNNNGEDDKDDDVDNELWPKEPLNDEGRYEDEMTRILIAESFVSVLLTCRFEHKNYASVSYDQSAVNCTLSMPTDLRVSISRRGHYEVSAPGKVNLKIEPDELIFSGEMCTTCAGRSTTVYNFHERSGPIVATIFTSTDLFGNVFEVKSDGRTSYRCGKSRGRSSKKFDFDENEDDIEDSFEMLEEEKKDERERNEERVRKSYDGGNDHGKYCEEYEESSSLGRVGKPYRIFSINRDFTAYEYLHRSVRREEEMGAVFNDRANVIHHPVSMHRWSQSRLITFVPLETEIPKVRPTNGDRRDFLRSTYSIPYDWLFPFGRNGRGFCSDTYDMPLAKTTERRRPPRALRLRILHGFKEPDRNAIIDLQRAMARYCQYILQDINECQGFVETRMSLLSEVEDDNKAWKDNIREFALGIRKYIDVESYLDTLQQQQEVRKEEKQPRVEETSQRLSQMLESRKSKDIQLNWYKRCMKDKIILPYFENVTGSCFLLVMECLDRAIPIWEEEGEGEEEKIEWSF